jgi:endoglucanase
MMHGSQFPPRKSLFLLWVLLALFAFFQAPLGFAAESANTIARRMGRGINILGYDGLWDGGHNAPFRKSDFARIRRAGFSHVRINVHAFRYMDPSHQLPPAFFSRLDWAVQEAASAGLIPVVDEHDFASCQDNPEDCRVRLRSFWQAMSNRYQDKYPTLVFELLNEPGGSMTAAQWNSISHELLTIIRETNHHRTLIIPSLNVDDTSTVEQLNIPEGDRNIIVAFHYYKPMQFTHQGAPWSKEFGKTNGISWGTAQERRQVIQDFDVVQRWAERTGRPVYLGEFGVYEAAGIAGRAEWLRSVRGEAERRGWAWAVWQFDHDFAVFDSTRSKWIAPLLRALIPTGSPSPSVPGRVAR